MSTQDAQKRLLHLHRENARLRRRIMADAATSDAAASIVANLAQSLAEARAEIDRLRACIFHESQCVEAAKEEMARLTAERDAFKESMYAELDTNLRLRELGGAKDDEPMTPFIERVIAERDALRVGRDELQADAGKWPQFREST